MPARFKPIFISHLQRKCISNFSFIWKHLASSWTMASSVPSKNWIYVRAVILAQSWTSYRSTNSTPITPKHHTTFTLLMCQPVRMVFISINSAFAPSVWPIDDSVAVMTGWKLFFMYSVAHFIPSSLWLFFKVGPVISLTFKKKKTWFSLRYVVLLDIPARQIFLKFIIELAVEIEEIKSSSCLYLRRSYSGSSMHLFCFVF